MRFQLTSWMDYLLLLCTCTVLHFTVTFLPSAEGEGLGKDSLSEEGQCMQVVNIPLHPSEQGFLLASAQGLIMSLILIYN